MSATMFSTNIHDLMIDHAVLIMVEKNSEHGNDEKYQRRANIVKMLIWHTHEDYEKAPMVLKRWQRKISLL